MFSRKYSNKLYISQVYRGVPPQSNPILPPLRPYMFVLVQFKVSLPLAFAPVCTQLYVADGEAPQSLANGLWFAPRGLSQFHTHRELAVTVYGECLGVSP